MEDYTVLRLHEDFSRQFYTIPVVFFLLGGISNSNQDSSSKMHQKAPQSTHTIQNFLGGMPPDHLEMVGPRAHQVPWLVSTSRYAPGHKVNKQGIIKIIENLKKK